MPVPAPVRRQRSALAAAGSLLLAATLAAPWLDARAQATPKPSDYEMESWRAATKVDTPDAYRAYLQAFPQGAFAAFARAALDKAAAAPATPTAQAGALAPFSAEIETNTVALRLGDRLQGPGVVTVGGFGSRRQLVLPRGEWVLLAAFDSRSKHQIPVPLATLAFGQFSGNELRSVLASTFTRRTGNAISGSGSSLVAMGMLPSWTAAERCEAANPQALHRAAGEMAKLRQCSTAWLLPDGADPYAELPGLAERVATALGQLKAQAAKLNLRSEVHLVDSRLGYMQYVRLDCAQPACGGTATSSAERVAWLQAFTPVVVAGYWRNLDVDDLVPGQPARADAKPALPL